MKTYLRILGFAKPLGQYVPQYIVYTLLSIIFGIINLTLVKPLFDVIFEQVGPEKLAEYSTKPSFELSVDGFNGFFDYLVHLFNYYLVQVIEEHGKLGSLGYICIVIVVSVLLSNLFKYLSAVILAQIRANVIENLRKKAFEKISYLHIGYFSNERKGDILSKLTNDVQEIEASVVNSLKVAFREPATIIIYFLVLFIMSFKLTLFTIIFLPVSGYIISTIAKRLKKKANESQESLGKVVGIIDETLSGMRVIKAFNARQYVTDKFGQEIKKYADINVNMAKKNELASPLSEFMGVFVVSVILLYGGNMVLNNSSSLDASGFLTYIIIFTQVLTPAKAISNSFSTIQRGLASGERIFKIIDTTPEIKDMEGAKKIESFNDSIAFKKVFFAYEKDSVLKNINIKIEKGKTIALVGPSGGGKSTISDLIPRFYDPTEGEILIDGTSLKEYQTESVRKLMGIVTQESILFNDTIFNNIAFGLTDVKFEDVEKAARIANAHDFILQTEKGYETEIGERGSKLSGGQRQRISIARAVLKNPPILIMDEATSALDSESEMLVQEALTNLMKNRTSIVIAHRLSTIQHADEILVIQQGEIVERGTHESLMKAEGMYNKLIMMQSL